MIIITGASRGIGKYLMDTYINKLSERVIGTYLNSIPPIENTSFFKVDVSDFEQVEQFAKSLGLKDEKLTLINCAGITYNAFTHKSEPVLWKDVIETNLFGTYNIIRAFLPHMRVQKFGRIINFSSVVAIKPTPGISSYTASKAALWGMSKTIAVENAAFNITINNINMGYSELGMIKMVPDKFLNAIVSQIPLGKLCEPVEIFNTVDFLRNSNYITGASIDLSGGLI